MELTKAEQATVERMRLAATTKLIRVRLSKAAADALSALAERECRDPRAQASYILEQILLEGDAQDVCVGPSEVSEEG